MSISDPQRQRLRRGARRRARRDFTINALFYDLEHGQILDWVGGMHDIERRVVRTIGDPETRFREDPVRILRAIKFAARLDLGIDPDVYDAMVCRARHARSRRAAAPLRRDPAAAARRQARTVRSGSPGSSAFSACSCRSSRRFSRRRRGGPARLAGLAACSTRSIAARCNEARPARRHRALDAASARADERGLRRRARSRRRRGDFLDPVIERLAVPRRFADAMRRIVALLPRLSVGRAGRFARTELFQLAVDVAAANLVADGK